jgi:ppGpp synthetase/RelA/SpoT-type nucleotidyltranferase
LKAEIQVRSILMHAWAELSHELSYKQKEDADVEEEYQAAISC